jgi:DhnA family fructose-bisphosphate aldolase class Ia
VNAGKTRRLQRLFDRGGRTVILPLDIVMPVGPYQGAENTGTLIDLGCAAGVDAVILRWGEAKRFVDHLRRDVGLIVRVSGSTGLNAAPQRLALLSTIESSLIIGGDAVCIDVEMGGDQEATSLRSLAGACEEAEKLGVVVMAEVHVNGEDPTASQAEGLAWGARTAQELGADLVKLAFPGSSEAVATICEQVQIPVVIAGGSRRDPRDVLQALAESLRGGAAGSAISRNVIGHPSPPLMQEAINDLVRGQRTFEDVWSQLQLAAVI